MFRIFVNKMNSRWNQIIFWIHDASTKIGLGAQTVWIYDKMHWSLSEKWQLIGGIPHAEYLLQHELYLANHQARYYANYAYDLQWAILEALPDVEETELIYEEKGEKKCKTAHLKSNP